MALLTRRGNKIDFDRNKLLSGEQAITIDEGKMYYCVAPGDVRELATKEDINDLLTAVPELYDKLQMLVGELENETLLQGILGDIDANTVNLATHKANYTSHLSGNSEVVQVTRDTSIIGAQTIALNTQKTPKSIQSLGAIDTASNTFSSGFCDELNAQTNIYMMSDGRFAHHAGSILMFSKNLTIDRTYAFITNISNGSISIDWRKTGIGATGNALIKLLISYHEGV